MSSDLAATLALKFNSALNDLATRHGTSIPVAELKALSLSLFMEGPPGGAVVAPTVAQVVAPTVAQVVASTAAPAAAAVVGPDQCQAMTKGKNAKPCSKKAVGPAPNGQKCCAQHGGVAPGKAAPAAAAAAAATSVSSGKAALLPTCSYNIKGANARVCGATAKHEGPDGKHYCAAHAKKVAGPGGAAKSNNTAAQRNIQLDAKEQPVITPKKEVGLGVDQHGICYVFGGDGPEGVGVLVGDQLQPLTPAAHEVLNNAKLAAVSAEVTTKLIAMTPAQRYEASGLQAAVAAATGQ